jgi:hypothetical protein
MQQWIVDELETVDLPDVRLDRRLGCILERLSANPQASFPQAFRGRSELEAAYLFFANPRLDEHNVLAPHVAATLARVRAQPVVLLVQDTTEADLTRPQEVVGGPLSDEKRVGLFAHPLLAFSPDRLPLGTVGLHVWQRDPRSFGKRRTRKSRPIRDKESWRWLEGYRRACAVAAAAPQTEVVCLSDSEGDIYECLLEARPQPGRRGARFIIRACHDRRLAAGGGGEPEGAALARKLSEALARRPELTRLTVEVSRRVALPTEKRKRKKARPQRQAELVVRAARLRLRGPPRSGAGLPGGRLPDLEVNCVLAREEAPPEGQEAVEWLLLTDLPVGTAEEALKVVSYYCIRWQAEVFLAVLKGGCRLEGRQLEGPEGFRVWLAVCLVLAWRVLHLTMLGRRDPAAPCAVAFDEEEWRAAYTFVQGQAPAVAPTLGEMITVVAELGGYVRRGKGGGPPGPKVMWRGLQRLAEITACWRAFRPARSAVLNC